MKRRIFSGMQPTGHLHIGNYLGALKNWAHLQYDYEPIFGIVFDGGFAMGSNLPLFGSEGDGFGGQQQVQTSTGETVVIPDRANSSSLSAGGLY